MAFHQPETKSIILPLKSVQTELNLHSINSIYKLTFGLNQFYVDITEKFDKYSSFTKQSNNTKLVAVSRNDQTSMVQSTPDLNKRYKLMERLGAGTFSQIFKAMDKYQHNKTVAIKFLKPGCELLAFRERLFLQYLANMSNRSHQTNCELSK